MIKEINSWLTFRVIFKKCAQTDALDLIQQLRLFLFEEKQGKLKSNSITILSIFEK